ncbi:pantetheine-phosphate adenylyltransferase [Caproiciproducens sp. NJN-50]|uniref:pantetheine-phosphate adenylyltransferase n=1 Tax=Acutalibacteraceae TaxID=3082771 RepID=UPI000FFE26ED|nr:MULTISPECIES: pantetheine-phosphate adenylyltransferase [Acutalibacteraceae]QAT50151.1 pantetheine-phosphate adenylyltransferase [Caproiciproducens sp. NJN-50]
MKIAICPGSFDPVTLGHMDIINRARKLFDHTIVAVLVNPEKHTAFTVEERINMLKRCARDMKDVEVVGFDGLIADYARIRDAAAIVKGLRAMSDFEYEFQMALFNKKLNPELETIYLNTTAENMFLSSSGVKQVACFGGDISNFVPECILQDIEQRLCVGGKRK